MINCGSKATNELHTIDRDTGKLRCLISRKEECRVFCNHVDNRFFVLTNKDLKSKEKCYDFKVMTISHPKQGDLNKLSLYNNEYVINNFYTPEDGEIVQEIDIFSNSLVLYIAKEGTAYMKVININDTKDVHTVVLGD